jgi:hypothetical protein
MKKAVFALLTVSLITLAVLPAACDKGTDPGVFSTYSLKGVAFSYPMEWVDGTADTEQEMALEDPAYSEYMPSGYTFTEDEMEFMASSMTGYMTAALDQPTIVSQGQITVSGQWAWQAEFSGNIEGVSAKAYELTVMSDDTIFILLFAAKSSVWNSLKSTYDTVKASIVF